jgi:hypothetical protein
LIDVTCASASMARRMANACAACCSMTVLYVIEASDVGLAKVGQK